jgi:hypothetical protein
MTITEAQRFEMHLGLRDKLGDDVTNTLMEHLPPSGWSDVARTHDINRLDDRISSLETRLDSRIDSLEKRMTTEFASVHRDLESVRQEVKGIRTTLRTTIGIMVTVAAGLMAMMFQLNQSIGG